MIYILGAALTKVANEN